MHWPGVLEQIFISSMGVTNHVLPELSAIINHSIGPDCSVPTVETNYNIWTLIPEFGDRRSGSGIKCLFVPWLPLRRDCWIFCLLVATGGLTLPLSIKTQSAHLRSALDWEGDPLSRI